MLPTRKQQVVDLLKSLETKATAPFAYVNPDKYIQHNLGVGPGPAGVTALIQSLPPDATVNTIRVFEDRDSSSPTPSTTSLVHASDSTSSASKMA